LFNANGEEYANETQLPSPIDHYIPVTVKRVA